MAAPTLYQPLGNIAAGSGYDTPTFAWSAVQGVHHYWLYVFDSATQQVVIDQRNLNTTSFTPAAVQGLTPGRQYTWYVFALSTNGMALNFVPGQTFTLASLPAPILSGPSGHIALDTPTFTWSNVNGATRYAVYVHDLTTNQSPSGVVLTAGTSFMPAAPLTRGHTYRWWVASVSANGMYTFVDNTLDFTVDV